MDPKPGIYSSEWWLSLAVVILGAVMASGLIVEGSWISQLIGALLAAAGAVGYTASRGIVKAAAKKAEGPPTMTPR